MTLLVLTVTYLPLKGDQAIIRQAQLHRPRGLREVDNFEGYRYKLSKVLRSSLCCQPRHPKLTKEGSMALVNRIPSCHYDINTTATTTPVFERLFLLTTSTCTTLMIMHFHDLPVSVLALLFVQMYHTIASSVDFPSIGDLVLFFFTTNRDKRQHCIRPEPKGLVLRLATTR
ncbi:hypothetical protein K435DRAFT_836741 [Dendrothele bispora CBS 962.96]|uniref:Uncharacterized protein n=1 Tax=Dendrothele bispora (strain CBS 962.96) TaxID=1314807 RepID=A0A4V4HHA9_DENBC|nr:hypothetical protein K435DRAFT_836741 [Dendrothele bispora CBS 962.96]